MVNKEDSNKATIYNENLDVALGQRYLAYALSTITDRHCLIAETVKANA